MLGVSTFASYRQLFASSLTKRLFTTKCCLVKDRCLKFWYACRLHWACNAVLRYARLVLYWNVCLWRKFEIIISIFVTLHELFCRQTQLQNIGVFHPNPTTSRIGIADSAKFDWMATNTIFWNSHEVNKNLLSRSNRSFQQAKMKVVVKFVYSLGHTIIDTTVVPQWRSWICLKWIDEELTNFFLALNKKALFEKVSVKDICLVNVPFAS